MTPVGGSPGPGRPPVANRPADTALVDQQLKALADLQLVAAAPGGAAQLSQAA